ncbi:3D domain-containing protein [Anaerovorax odorimutans]|uniref:3D domain-containing protein n=1 Tax=Anaerovorax odorimutans TaxID=109327 RepID=UPI002731B6C2|nr:3D domain-containing protein [Anaerovorax odorimutans]
MKKEEVSKARRLGALSVSAIMLMTVFTPLSAFAETAETAETEPAGETAAASQQTRGAQTFSQAATQETTSTQAPAASQAPKTLAAPAGVKAKSVGMKTIKIQWKKVEGASGYRVYRSTKKNGKYKKIATVKGGKTSYNNKKRTTGKTYYYKVRAYSGSVQSGYSKTVSAKARPVKTVVKAKAGEEKITVTWKKISGASGYHVYRSGSKNGKYKRIKTINKGKITRFTNSKLKGGKSYYYKVRAYKKIKGKKVFAAYSAPASAKAKKVKLKTHKKGFSYKKKFVVKAYAYSGGGRTAMGTKARVGAIAVDPKVIPLGTKVYVDGYGHARAEDTGGNIKGKTVDLYMNSSSKCYKWGVKYKTVYVDVRK